MKRATKKAAAAQEEWVSVEEFAEFLGVSVEEVLRRARQGRYEIQDFCVLANGSPPVPVASFCGRKPPSRAIRAARRKSL